MRINKDQQDIQDKSKAYSLAIMAIYVPTREHANEGGCARVICS